MTEAAYQRSAGHTKKASEMKQSVWRARRQSRVK